MSELGKQKEHIEEIKNVIHNRKGKHMLDIKDNLSNKLREETINFPMGKHKLPYSLYKNQSQVYWIWILKSYILRNLKKTIIKQLSDFNRGKKLLGNNVEIKFSTKKLKISVSEKQN